MHLNAKCFTDGLAGFLLIPLWTVREPDADGLGTPTPEVDWEEESAFLELLTFRQVYAVCICMNRPKIEHKFRCV